jgi:hypothetical protein
MLPELATLGDFAMRYTVAWCSQNAANDVRFCWRNVISGDPTRRIIARFGRQCLIDAADSDGRRNTPLIGWSHNSFPKEPNSQAVLN